MRDSRYRGTGEAGVAPASAYWDLIKLGYKAAYLSARVLESITAYRQLRAAGLVVAADGFDLASYIEGYDASKFFDPHAALARLRRSMRDRVSRKRTKRASSSCSLLYERE